jgi:hypothetical protein
VSEYEGMKQPAVFLVGNNAVSWAEAWTNPEMQGATPDASADADGHVVSATVLRRGGPETPMSPVRAVVSHGVAPTTAVAMLRKMADLIEQTPEILSAEPGNSARRLPDGGVSKTRVTLDNLRQASGMLDEDTRRKLLEAFGEIGPAIDDPPPERPLDEL